MFEGEKKYIFHDKSKEGFQDHPDLAKLATFEHVILSSHIAFYTDQVINQDFYISKVIMWQENTCCIIRSERLDAYANFMLIIRHFKA